jgi:hypothetical protein
MKPALLLGILFFATIASVAFAGSEYSGKEMKQVDVQLNTLHFFAPERAHCT